MLTACPFLKVFERLFILKWKQRLKMSITGLFKDIKNKKSCIVVSMGESDTGYIDIIRDVAAAILVDPERYAEYGSDGIAQMRKIFDYARENGVYTISDCRKISFAPRSIVKGIHSDGYIFSEAYNKDEIQDFVFEANRYGKTVFGSICQKDTICELAGQGFTETGYSNLGMVTSLCFLQEIRDLRKNLSMSIFIIENYGGISQKYDIVRSHFKGNCTGSLVVIPAENIRNKHNAEKLRLEINKTVNGGILR